jgi:hypothetical protein
VLQGELQRELRILAAQCSFPRRWYEQTSGLGRADPASRGRGLTASMIIGNGEESKSNNSLWTLKSFPSNDRHAHEICPRLHSCLSRLLQHCLHHTGASSPTAPGELLNF